MKGELSYVCGVCGGQFAVIAGMTQRLRWCVGSWHGHMLVILQSSV